MPDQMRMSMPGGNRCSGWAVTAVDALARDVSRSARGRGCRAVSARMAARVPRKRTAEGKRMELASYLFEEATRLLINPRLNMSRSKGWEPLGFYSK